jgi:NAD(P)-dependent dehydrogenase (short-subunit alcohol dehydrogenase family)
MSTTSTSRSSARPVHDLVVDQEVDDAATLAREGGEPADVHPGRAGDLAQARELAGRVAEDDGQVGGHRDAIFSGAGVGCERNARKEQP